MKRAFIIEAKSGLVSDLLHLASKNKLCKNNFFCSNNIELVGNKIYFSKL